MKNILNVFLKVSFKIFVLAQYFKL